MMTGFPKTFPSQLPKVRYLSVKSALPEFSGILRRINRIKRIGCHVVRFGTSPTRAGGQDD
eukprot:12207393-Karenia_brevis.AAC.1